MVRSRIRINKRLERLKRIKRKKPPRIDVRQLEKVAPIFLLELQNRFEVLANETPSIEILNESITKTAAEVSEKRIETEEEVNAEDKVIEQLEQRRKEPRKKDNKTRAERVEYSEVNKTVKKKRRVRARRKRKDFVISILQQRKGPKETHKYKSKKKISCMKDNDGHKTTDREEILEICKSFYKTLFESTLPTPTNCEKESPYSDEVPPFTTNEVIEKSNEYNLPLCVGFIDYEKAFESVEHFAIFDALRKININETYITILENIYRNASARVHIDNLESEPFPILRGVRQGDPISPKLFTAAIEMIFRKADLEHGLNVDGETLTNLRFADDVALVQKKNGKRSRGRQARRWRDDIVKTKGNTCSRDARDRDEWRRDAEGYILQWMDRAS
ncbi:endonuclease-reverse transcriptase [Plakobranchus ocellatus]|uniref:Endonuclease-reverse transcriptase n=1 Tax=Plakobranchus ocellatus TaxID=259542 RepID=A0AAV4B9V9_9GAST|nr:endonuclease-reverse transcriptase [Plakobranchus ocellatus]